jgi:hypothetical protein
VNCEVCGTELPHGAMFCGECGRAVGSRPVQALHPDTGMPQAQPGSGSSAAGSRDTVIIEPIRMERLPEFESELSLAADPAPAVEVDEREPEPEPGVEQDLPPELIAEELDQDLPEFESERDPEPEPGPDPKADPEPEPAAEPEFVAEEDAGPEPATPGVRASSSRIPTRPDPFPWGDRGSAIFLDSDELEQTLIVPRREAGERFVLQFSTGESVTVFGSGLLGRNPAPQPSEYFDQLLTISDPGKSVSKTHLEFGQEGGSFWVSDRFSGNGSAVREPEAPPRRLVAGKRYRIVRGTRVDIGEQFFVVS